MPKKRTPDAAGPVKQIRRSGVTVDFNRVKEPSPSGLYYYDHENRHQALYPSVYSTKVAGQGFFPFWDFFTDKYFEDLQLIDSEQAWLYTYLASLRNRGLRLSVNGHRGTPKPDSERKGLAAMLRRSPRRVIEDLDHLEDCLLIHRVRRLDIRGTPNDIIVHTPFTAVELADGFHERIAERIKDKVTFTARSKKMRTGVDESGRPYAYLHRGSTSGERFQYDAGQITEAFGHNRHKFAEWALTYFQKYWPNIDHDKQRFDRDYRHELQAELERYNIRDNSIREKCYAAANKFRTIYCPSMQELLAV